MGEYGEDCEKDENEHCEKRSISPFKNLVHPPRTTIGVCFDLYNIQHVLNR